MPKTDNVARKTIALPIINFLPSNPYLFVRLAGRSSGHDGSLLLLIVFYARGNSPQPTSLLRGVLETGGFERAHKYVPWMSLPIISVIRSAVVTRVHFVLWRPGKVDLVLL